MNKQKFESPLDPIMNILNSELEDIRKDLLNPTKYKDINSFSSLIERLAALAVLYRDANALLEAMSPIMRALLRSLEERNADNIPQEPS